MKAPARKFYLRVLACIAGNLIIALGVALAKIADLGVDPYNGMCMSVSSFIGIPYPVFTWGFNLACFALEIIWGRKYVQAGTFINWFLVSFAVTFFLWIYEHILPYPEAFASRIPVLAVSLAVASFGVALYQLADLGISPYDVLPFLVTDRSPKLPYFWVRLVVDSLCVVGMFLTHSTLIGIGTLLYAVGLGPVIHFFTNLLKKTALFREESKKSIPQKG